MKKLFSVIGILLLILLGISLVGFLFPSEHTTRGVRSFENSPREMWVVLDDVKHYAGWRHDVHHVEMLTTEDSVIRWREHMKDGQSHTFELAASQPYFRRVVKIVDDETAYSGQWTFEIHEKEGGCQVVIVERATITNPLFRMGFALFMDPSASIERFLDALVQRQQAVKLLRP